MSKYPLSLMLTACILTAAGRVAASDGYYDPIWPAGIGGGYFAFNGDYAHPAEDTYASMLTVDASGNAILGGTINGTWWLGELFANGSFVPTFGLADGSGRTNGCSMSGLCNSSYPFSAAALGDGRYLILGGSTLTLTTSAAHDASVSVPVDHLMINDAQGYVSGRGVVALPGGGAIVVGDGFYSAISGVSGFGVARLTSTLMLDTSFNTVTDNQSVTFAGGAVYPIGPGPVVRADAALVQPDGRIVIVGVTGDIAVGGAVGLIRLNPDGSLDATFGTGGKLTVSLSGHPNEMGYLLAPILDRAGRIVIGTSQPDAVHGSSGMLIVRVNANGSPDFFPPIQANAFPSTCDYIDQRGSVAIDSAGRILVSGYCASGTKDKFAVVRLRGDTGVVDASFGIGGLSYGWFDATSSEDWALATAFDHSGHPLVAGFTSPASSGHKAGIARLSYDLIFTNDLEAAPRGCLPPQCN
ncbi:MAG TPA: delta-60 repeat domain-containing protein [Pseudolabrys sp.]|jgi:uncharacterized delta-60 repeat protein|nr:delta-60 repeat domain-containing protein [Pseudolabrys sp.]